MAIRVDEVSSRAQGHNLGLLILYTPAKTEQGTGL